MHPTTIRSIQAAPDGTVTIILDRHTCQHRKPLQHLELTLTLADQNSLIQRLRLAHEARNPHNPITKEP